MKSKYLLSFSFIALITFSVSCQSKMQDLDFLIGTWKVENKESYEIWGKINKNQLKGNSYKMKDGEKRITENLSINKVKKEIVYEAQVLNQNDGQAVPFTLNNDEKNLISFENANHDFPKKIQYKKLSNNLLQVNVLGENDQGFSYKLVRLEE